MTARRVAMDALVVEKDVRIEGCEKTPLVEPAEKECLVDADIPSTQGTDHPLVRGRTARGHERGAQRRCLGRKECLKLMDRHQQTLKGSTG